MKNLKMPFNLLLTLGLNTKVLKKIPTHVSVFGGYITDNNTDQSQ